MTQDEIIEMAKEAGFKMENSAAIQAAEIFAKLVAAKATAVEKEACAKVVDARLEKWLRLFGKKDKMYKWMIDLPEIIRARGEA